MKHLFILSALIVGLSAGAQDAKFSQYEAAPLLLNPAQTGNFYGNVRFGVLGSHQRAEPATLNHGTGFVDYRGDNGLGTYGVGVSYYHNWHSKFQLTGKFVTLSVAQHIELDAAGTHRLSLGAQVAMASGLANADNPYFDPHLSGGGFNMGPDGKADGSKSYTDFNAGLLYSYKGEGVEVETGIAAYHVFGPDNRFSTVADGHQGRRVDFTANAIIELHPFTKMHLTSLIWKEGLYWKAAPTESPVMDAIYGVMLESLNSDESSILYGLSTRSANTLIIKGGVNYKTKLRLVASYERPVNDDTYPVRRGELSALFTL